MIGSSPLGRLPEPALTLLPIGRPIAAFVKEEMMKGLGFQRLVEIHPQDPQAPLVFGPGENEKPGKGTSFEELADFKLQVLSAAADDPALAVLFQCPAAPAVPPSGPNLGSGFR